MTKSTATGGELFTIDQVCDYLQLCRSTVCKLIREKQLASVIVGARSRRVPRAALEEYVNTQLVRPAK